MIIILIIIQNILIINPGIIIKTLAKMQLNDPYVTIKSPLLTFTKLLIQ